jgi:hypothetical protein
VERGGASPDQLFSERMEQREALRLQLAMQAMDIMPAIGLCALSGWTAWWIGNLVLAPAWIVLIVRAGLFLGLWAGGILFLRKVFFNDFWTHLTSALAWFGHKRSVKTYPSPIPCA